MLLLEEELSVQVADINGVQVNLQGDVMSVITANFSQPVAQAPPQLFTQQFYINHMTNKERNSLDRVSSIHFKISPCCKVCF